MKIQNVKGMAGSLLSNVKPRQSNLMQCSAAQANLLQDIVKNDAFVKPDAGGSVCKTMDKETIQLIRMYLMSKNLSIGVTPQKYASIEKYDGEEFISEAYELLLKKMNIPNQLAPDISYSNDDVPYAMLYSLSNNQIFINKKIDLKDKLNAFIAMRHELQHFLQNMLMLRHETKGDSLVNYYINMTKTAMRENFDKMVKTFNINQLQQTIGDPSVIYHILGLRNLVQNNHINEYERALDIIIDSQLAIYASDLKKFRNDVISEMGVVKEGTKDAKRAEKFYDETTNQNGYWKGGNDVHYGKYLADSRENEAIIAQDVLRFEVTGTKCYVAAWKKATSDFLNQKGIEETKLVRDVVSDIQNRQAESDDWWDKYIDHLYN